MFQNITIPGGSLRLQMTFTDVFNDNSHLIPSCESSAHLCKDNYE